MLSILIPAYNYNVVPLIKALHQQCSHCNINFEICVYDDGSKSEYNNNNTTINNLEHCLFIELPYNIGRSQIRNKLAEDAKFEHLLFLDCDTLPKNEHFIANYIQHLAKDVIYGGITHDPNPPKKPYKLRWLFTKKREQKAMCSSNFFIKKKIMTANLFDASIEKYGYEDVIFFKNLEQKAIRITPIKNPVIHLGNETSKVYINKIETSLWTLNTLIQNEKITAKDSKIYAYYKLLSKLHLIGTARFCFKATKNLILKNFDSAHPSLFLFDMYRLGFFCTIKSKS